VIGAHPSPDATRSPLSGGLERVRKPGGLTARVVNVEGHAAEASFAIEGAGVLATLAVVVPIDREEERVSGQLTAGIRLSTTNNAARAPKTPVSFLDYVEHELKTVALRDRPLPVDVARHDRHSPFLKVVWINAAPTGTSCQAIPIIIVLGEVVFGVVDGLSASERDVKSVTTGMLALVVGFGFWWLYFDLVGRRAPRHEARALAGWLVGHLPTTLSITAAGAAMVSLIATPMTDARPTTPPGCCRAPSRPACSR
jgi:Bacterial low temperature requirement A protein (LtrA)